MFGGAAAAECLICRLRTTPGRNSTSSGLLGRCVGTVRLVEAQLFAGHEFAFGSHGHLSRRYRLGNTSRERAPHDDAEVTLCEMGVVHVRTKLCEGTRLVDLSALRPRHVIVQDSTPFVHERLGRGAVTGCGENTANLGPKLG